MSYPGTLLHKENKVEQTITLGYVENLLGHIQRFTDSHFCGRRELSAWMTDTVERLTQQKKTLLVLSCWHLEVQLHSAGFSRRWRGLCRFFVQRWGGLWTGFQSPTWAVISGCTLHFFLLTLFFLSTSQPHLRTAFQLQKKALSGEVKLKIK